MTTEKSVVLKVFCRQWGDCGVYSVYRFYQDGSFQAILNACGHEKKMPTTTSIRERINLCQRQT